MIVFIVIIGSTGESKEKEKILILAISLLLILPNKVFYGRRENGEWLGKLVIDDVTRNSNFPKTL